MSNDLMSLDDIIKKSRNTKNSMRPKGPRKGVARNGSKANGATAAKSKPMTRIEDARFKIIQKKRTHITDARDKLAQIAKQTDARLKLQKLRGNVTKKPETRTSSRKQLISNGRLPMPSSKYSSSQVSQSMAVSLPPPRIASYRDPATIIPESQFVTNLLMNYAGDYLINRQPGLKRTVNNQYNAPTQLSSLFHDDSTQYNWNNPLSHQSNNSIPRSLIMRSADHNSRPRDYKVIPRTGMASKSESSTFKDKSSWSFSSKSRTILPENSMESKYYSSMRNQRDSNVKARLDSGTSKNKNTLSNSSRSKSNNSQPNGFRIVVSNLQPNVTQEDIKELFEDVGELQVSRLVRPGTAEVVYETLKDATRAVETYHNRQLDGHPMKCLLVNPRPKTSSSSSSSRILPHSRGSSSAYSRPSLGVVHRALFN